MFRLAISTRFDKLSGRGSSPNEEVSDQLKLMLKFFKSEIAVGIFLFASAIAAQFVINFDEEFYHGLLSFSLASSDFTLHHFINDALMSLFFLLIGLELKKEILVGELSNKKKIFLPLIAAIGGVIFPALIFIFFNFSDKNNLRGFAIPSATDIAFAYGMISLFGKRISNSAKVFLVTLAIIDDVFAILFIAFFYSQNLDFSFLLFSTLPLIALTILNFKRCEKISLYLISGFFLWLFILKSGFHPTLAGVLLALFIPLQISNKSLLSKLSHNLAPLVNFFILPLFAFANCGIKIADFSWQILFEPLVLGIALGLFLGKQFGVMLFSFLAVKLKIAQLPHRTNWLEFYAIAIFSGIGFTMSLFISGLSFLGNSTAENFVFNEAKIGVLLGSLLAIIYGSLVVFLSLKSSLKRHHLVVIDTN